MPNFGFMLGSFGVIEIVVIDVLLIFPQRTTDSWHMQSVSARTCET